MAKFDSATLNLQNSGKVLYMLPSVAGEKKLAKVFMSELLSCGGHGERSKREKCNFQVRWEIRMESPETVAIQIFGNHSEGFKPLTTGLHLAWLTKQFLTQLDTCQVE